jgi:endoglycosylceramidase
MHMRLSRAASLAAACLLIAALTTDASSVVAPPAAQAAAIGPTMPLGHAGRWMIDADGRAVILHGLNQVYRVPPYEPSADGFGDDDAAFLAANGFNAMRLGVIWAAVEPQPLSYDDTYLTSIAQTVQTLAAHGIDSLLDFHQDLYNEVFQGEGAPAWAVQTGGLPNPQLGFPGNYFLNSGAVDGVRRYRRPGKPQRSLAPRRPSQDELAGMGIHGQRQDQLLADRPSAGL